MDILLREYGRIIWLKRFPAFLMLLGISGAIGLDIMAPLIYKNIANGLAQPFTPDIREMLIQNLMWLAGVFIAIWLCWRLVEFSVIPLEAGGMALLDKRCFEVILRQRYSYFEGNFSGSIVKQSGRFVKSYETIIDWFVFQLFSNVLSITLAFVIFWFQQPEFAMYFLVWAVIFISWSVFFSIWKLKFDKRVAEWDSKIGGAFSDSISNIFIVKSFALEREEKQTVSDYADETFRRRRTAWILMFISFAVQGILAFSIEIILIYLMIDKWESGLFEIGVFVLFQAVLIKLIHGLWDFGRNFQRFFTAVADASEMAEVFRKTALDQDQPGTAAHPINDGHIRFEQLNFNYSGAIGPSAGLFESFNLDIKAGEKVALVGHSGSGKTSLTKLLFRFIEPQSGTVRIDDHDVKQFTLSSLRSQISLIPQQPELFHRSIRDNITLGKDISDEAVYEVLEKAGAREFVEAMPDKLDTLVGERGVKLSGGEKQRVAIARAFLDGAKVVVLDEATSALDSITEQAIQQALFKLIEDKTAIVIAHRLSTILRMDRIIVLDHGQIIEQGTHAELLEKRGRYFEMWQHQSGEFIGD
ncbi:ABC transporter ATP-binding protein [Leucothrix pacifica]|uniref:ABC transporter ATP-binding protein n=1 Tax=Leucothrix pacifica TaxID=1247513 RepID=A0A317C5I9_9GAMM|nr:ABC transporter ATP-binding protein [Leucothrix pacifica]PWQ92633.1 ABC transporter ATP-binding protein [Leucothrix pacifica]